MRSSARTAALGLAMAALPACNEPRPVDIAGAWTGTMTDATGTRAVEAQFTQRGAHIDGLGTASRTPGGSQASSRWIGTILDGPLFSFSLAITDPPCAISVAGNAQVTASTFEATYVGRDDCGTPPWGDGRMSLRRR